MFNTSKAKSLLLVTIMLVAAVGLGAAAAPTVDTETTETSQSSDLTDAGTQAYNATTTSNLSWSADSANSSVEITQNGRTIYEASPSAYYENSTSGTYYYNVTLADDGSDYSGLEVGAGESVTLNVTFTNDTEASSPDTTNISYTFSNTEGQAFIASENPEGEEMDDSGYLSSITFWSNDSDTQDVGTQLSTDSVNITENTSTVTLDTMSSNLSNAFEASTSEASEGDLIWSSYSQVSMGDDSQFVPVYYQSANEDHSWLNTTEDAYATISSDGETMTIHNPDALLDDGQSTGTLDVTTVGDEKLGFGNARTMLTDNYDVSPGDAIWTALGARDVFGSPDFVTEALEG